MQLLPPYTEASHHPCCQSLLLFISTVTWAGATTKVARIVQNTGAL